MPRTDFSVVEVPVEGSRGDEYTVWIVGGIPTSCTCPHYKHRCSVEGTLCKHMRARSGRKALGVTRCASCWAWLTPEEIKAQPTPPDDQELIRLCSLCQPPAG